MIVPGGGAGGGGGGGLADKIYKRATLVGSPARDIVVATLGEVAETAVPGIGSSHNIVE